MFLTRFRLPNLFEQEKQSQTKMQSAEKGVRTSSLRHTHNPRRLLACSVRDEGEFDIIPRCQGYVCGLGSSVKGVVTSDCSRQQSPEAIACGVQGGRTTVVGEAFDSGQRPRHSGVVVAE